MMKSDLAPRPRTGRSSATRVGREETEVLMEKGLPANIDAERFILGSLLLDGSKFVEIAPRSAKTILPWKNTAEFLLE